MLISYILFQHFEPTRGIENQRVRFFFAYGNSRHVVLIIIRLSKQFKDFTVILSRKKSFECILNIGFFLAPFQMQIIDVNLDLDFVDFQHTTHSEIVRLQIGFGLKCVCVETCTHTEKKITFHIFKFGLHCIASIEGIHSQCATLGFTRSVLSQVLTLLLLQANLP